MTMWLEPPPKFGNPSVILEKWERRLKMLEAAPKNPEIDLDIKQAKWVIEQTKMQAQTH